MATVTSKNSQFDCFYNSNSNNSTFALAAQSGNYGRVVIRIDKNDLGNLIKVLQDFEDKMKFAGAIK